MLDTLAFCWHLTCKVWTMCQQKSEFQPLMQDDEEFCICRSDKGVEVVFRSHDGTERTMVIPMRSVEPTQRAAA